MNNFQKKQIVQVSSGFVVLKERLVNSSSSLHCGFRDPATILRLLLCLKVSEAARGEISQWR